MRRRLAAWEPSDWWRRPSTEDRRHGKPACLRCPLWLVSGSGLEASAFAERTRAFVETDLALAETRAASAWPAVAFGGAEEKRRGLAPAAGAPACGIPEPTVRVRHGCRC